MGATVKKISIGYASYPLSQIVADGKRPSQADGAAAEYGASGYYTAPGMPPGIWMGRGLGMVGTREGSEADKKAVRLLFDGERHPESGEALLRIPAATRPAAAPKDGDGGDRPAPSAAPRMPVTGWDETFNCPKSISIAWALADEPTRQAIHECFVQSVADSLAYLEDHDAWTRTGRGGVRHVKADGVTAIRFDHMDNRDREPHLHAHLLVSNVVTRPDGRHGALDGDAILRGEVALSERHTDILMQLLRDRLGFRFEQRRHPAPGGRMVTTWEIAGIGDDMIDAFSRRRRDLARRTDELAREWSDANDGKAPDPVTLNQLADQAWKETRRAKDDPDHAETQAQRLGRWAREARGLLPEGTDPGRWVASLARRPGVTMPPAALADRHAAMDMLRTLVAQEMAQRGGAATALGDGDVLDWIAMETQEGSTDFGRDGVLATVHRVLRGVPFSYDPAGYDGLAERITDDVCARLVEVTPARYKVDPAAFGDATLTWGADGPGVSIFDTAPRRMRYVTPTLRAAEERFATLAAARTGRTPSPTLVATAVEAADDRMRRDTGHGLAADQRACVEAVLRDDHAVMGMVGPAGSGKTTTMQALIAAHGMLSDGQVLGISPTARGAAELSASISRPCNTVQAILTEADHHALARRMDRLRAVADDPSAGGDDRSAARQELAACAAQAESLRIPRGGLVIVDEASMADTVQAARLAGMCQEAGARMLMVGDPLQLGSPGIGGGALQWLADHGQSCELTGIYRFRGGAAGEARPVPAGDGGPGIESVGWLDAKGEYHPVADPGGPIILDEGCSFAYRCRGDAVAHCTVDRLPAGDGLPAGWRYRIRVLDGDGRTVEERTQDAYSLDGLAVGGDGEGMREAHASTLLRDGGKAPDDGAAGRWLATREYLALGRIHPGESGSAADRAFAEAYADFREGRDSILVALDNGMADDINLHMSIALRNTPVGRAPDGTTLWATDPDPRDMTRLGDGVRYGVGDVICTRKVERRFLDSEGGFVRNGDLWRIDGVASRGPDGKPTALRLVRRGGTAQITIGADWLARNAQGGYCATAQRDQGVTVDRAYVILPAGAAPSARALYVAMTRGRHGNDLFVDLTPLSGLDADSDEQSGPLHEWAERKRRRLEAAGRSEWTGKGAPPDDGHWYTRRDLLPDLTERAADAVDRILDTRSKSLMSTEKQALYERRKASPSTLMAERTSAVVALLAPRLTALLTQACGGERAAGIGRQDGWDRLVLAWGTATLADPAAARDALREAAARPDADATSLADALHKTAGDARDIRFAPASAMPSGTDVEKAAADWLAQNERLLAAAGDTLATACEEGHAPVWARKLGAPPAHGTHAREGWESLLRDTMAWRAATGARDPQDPLPRWPRPDPGLDAMGRALRARWHAWNATGEASRPRRDTAAPPAATDPFLADMPAVPLPAREAGLCEDMLDDPGACDRLDAIVRDTALDWLDGKDRTVDAARERMGNVIRMYAAANGEDAGDGAGRMAGALMRPAMRAARGVARRLAGGGCGTRARATAIRRSAAPHGDGIRAAAGMDTDRPDFHAPHARRTHGLPPACTGLIARTPSAWPCGVGWGVREEAGLLDTVNGLAEACAADDAFASWCRCAVDAAARSYLTGAYDPRLLQNTLAKPVADMARAKGLDPDRGGLAARTAYRVASDLVDAVDERVHSLAERGVGAAPVIRETRRARRAQLCDWRSQSVDEPGGWWRSHVTIGARGVDDALARMEPVIHEAHTRLIAPPPQEPDDLPLSPPEAKGAGHGMDDAWRLAVERTAASGMRRALARNAAHRLGVAAAGTAILLHGDPTDGLGGIDGPEDGRMLLLVASRDTGGQVRRVIAFDPDTGAERSGDGADPWYPDGLDADALARLRRSGVVIIARSPLERLRVDALARQTGMHGSPCVVSPAHEGQGDPRMLERLDGILAGADLPDGLRIRTMATDPGLRDALNDSARRLAENDMLRALAWKATDGAYRRQPSL